MHAEGSALLEFYLGRGLTATSRTSIILPWPRPGSNIENFIRRLAGLATRGEAGWGQRVGVAARWGSTTGQRMFKVELTNEKETPLLVSA